MDAVDGAEIYTPVEQALDELRRRRQDHALVARVTAFLDGDIPEYLKEHDCFVLPRHIATPNNEALYVLGQARRFGVRAVFSQDPKDRFTSVNNLKRRLARPHVCEETPNGRRYGKLDIVDVPQAEGLPIDEVRCRDGKRLLDFHNGLFDKIAGTDFLVADDSDWIDRNHRGDRTSHYQKFLALFVTHGVVFEDFETGNDPQFLQQFVRPALADMRRTLGVLPIIVRPYPEGSSPDERFDLAHQQTILGLARF